MGGSGSTGSSLLKNILNRHQEVFAGGETAFFAKKMIYENWMKARKRVLKRKFYGLRNHGWHLYNGTDLLQPEYLWKKEELENLLLESKTLKDFTKSYYAKPLQLKRASISLEKTPANAACFSSFLQSYEDGKVIHMVRNPFDTIASLCSRGYNLYYAVGIYLLNTASGLSVQSSNRSITVKYEDLVSSPAATVQGLCRFLDIEYDARMLEPQGEEVHLPKHDGWNYDETKAIGKQAVGRFNKLPESEQDAILEAVNLIFINRRGKTYYDIKVERIKDVCEELGYDFYQIGKKNHLRSLKSDRQKDIRMRLSRGYPTGFYYPLEIMK